MYNHTKCHKKIYKVQPQNGKKCNENTDDKMLK